jgi:hypothetical protein
MFTRLTTAACVCALVIAPAFGQSSETPSKALPKSDAPASPAPDAAEVRFTGEIFHGEAFEREIGHNLVFRLTPAISDEGGGWVIQITPPAEPQDDPIEFSEIATPPYHAYNDRYLAAAFGYSAKEVVKVITRKFNFVKSVADVHVANEVVNAALYPSAISEVERVRVAAKAADIKLGSGELRILHARVETQKGLPDVIAWVKFEVVLNFAPGLTLQQVLAPKPPSTP